MTFLYIFTFIASFFLLAFSSNRLVTSLTRIAKFLGWKEFVVAFFTMALAGSIPNLSVGISSVFHQISKLSFSEIVGGNIVDLTLAVALATLVAADGLALPSRTVQGSAIFTLFIAILPLILIIDGTLSRAEGILLILAFVVYASWLFGKRERFIKSYDTIAPPIEAKAILKDAVILVGSIALLLLAAEGIVGAATFFSEILNLPIVLIGILVVGLGNALPEIFFGIQAARRGEDWMVLGNLMGSVIFPATLVLGLVALLYPIEVVNFSPFLIGRFFLVISAIFFLIFIRTGRRVSKKEAIFLLSLYLLFILAEILIT